MRRAKEVEVNEAERRILEQITRETKSRAGLVTRSHIILGAAAGLRITAQTLAAHHHAGQCSSPDPAQYPGP